jgi:hypothetical protein
MEIDTLPDLQFQGYERDTLFSLIERHTDIVKDDERRPVMNIVIIK